MEFRWDAQLWAAATRTWTADLASRKGLRLESGCGSCTAVVQVEQCHARSFAFTLRHEEGCAWLREVEEYRALYG